MHGLQGYFMQSVLELAFVILPIAVNQVMSHLIAALGTFGCSDSFFHSLRSISLRFCPLLLQLLGGFLQPVQDVLVILAPEPFISWHCF